MPDTRLYGALPGRNPPPDWDVYDAFEIAGCTSGRVPTGNVAFSRATSYVVFGHRIDGTVVPITDATTLANARTVCSELAGLSGKRNA